MNGKMREPPITNRKAGWFKVGIQTAAAAEIAIRCVEGGRRLNGETRAPPEVKFSSRSGVVCQTKSRARVWAARSLTTW